MVKQKQYLQNGGILHCRPIRTLYEQIDVGLQYRCILTCNARRISLLSTEYAIGGGLVRCSFQLGKSLELFGLNFGLRQGTDVEETP